MGGGLYSKQVYLQAYIFYPKGALDHQAWLDDRYYLQVGWGWKNCQQCRYRKWLWHSRWGISISSGQLCTHAKVIFKLAASYLRWLFLVFEYFAKPAPAPGADAGFFRWQISDCRIRSWVPQPTAALAATIKSLISLLYLPHPVGTVGTTHYCHRRQLSSSWIPTMSLLSPSGEPSSQVPS